MRRPPHQLKDCPADVIIADTAYDADHFAQKHRPPKAIAVIPN
ncbi:hypothetical protein GGD65_006320 [Bradyrhizobium sp. CIR18]|nr:hypothetical protein [Bradyrhizobium sp. CIR18]